MKKLALTITLVILSLASCKNSQQNNTDKTKLKITETKTTVGTKTTGETKRTCVFQTPDTSIAGIKLVDSKSTAKILGKSTKLKPQSNKFYSSNKNQILTLVVYPGGNYNDVSLFKVSYSKNENQNFRILNEDIFQSEKGIHLGIDKDKIVAKLGKCYKIKDSVKNKLTLHYEIRIKNDNTGEFLHRYNMPFYYANYTLKNDRLIHFEFGFEYP